MGLVADVHLQAMTWCLAYLKVSHASVNTSNSPIFLYSDLQGPMPWHMHLISRSPHASGIASMASRHVWYVWDSFYKHIIKHSTCLCTYTQTYIIVRPTYLQKQYKCTDYYKQRLTYTHLHFVLMYILDMGMILSIYKSHGAFVQIGLRVNLNP